MDFRRKTKDDGREVLYSRELDTGDESMCVVTPYGTTLKMRDRKGVDYSVVLVRREIVALIRANLAPSASPWLATACRRIKQKLDSLRKR